MDINDARSILTVLSFACFVGIALWAYSGRNKARFDEAANLPFDDDELPSSRGGPAITRGRAS
jgi:cytochrome c oxidase cbb3-type subunit 4